MISRYVLNKDKLIIYLDFNYEFSKNVNSSISFKQTILNFIKNHKIDFQKGKIVLVVGGIFLASFFINNQRISFDSFNDKYNVTYTSVFESVRKIPSEIKIPKQENKENEVTTSSKNISKKGIIKTEEKNSVQTKSNTKSKTKEKTISKKEVNIESNKTSTTKSSNLVTIYRSNGSVLTMDMEEYVIGVVAAEMPAAFNIEALKAQSILARTYAKKSIQNKKKLTDTVTTQAYIDIDQMQKKWGSEFDKYYNKIKNACDSTKGMYITYNGTVIDAVYHAISNGKTEDSIEVWGYSVPYLKSVDSEWDKETKGYLKEVIIPASKVLSTFGINSLEEIKIISRNSSGRIKEVQVSNDIYSGVDIRKILNLRSADFDVEIESDGLKITTRGYGHGVGLSQYGANKMANLGYNYESIIKHYYSGVKIVK